MLDGATGTDAFLVVLAWDGAAALEMFLATLVTLDGAAAWVTFLATLVALEGAAA